MGLQSRRLIYRDSQGNILKTRPPYPHRNLTCSCGGGVTTSCAGGGWCGCGDCCDMDSGPDNADGSGCGGGAPLPQTYIRDTGYSNAKGKGCGTCNKWGYGQQQALASGNLLEVPVGQVVKSCNTGCKCSMTNFPNWKGSYTCSPNVATPLKKNFSGFSGTGEGEVMCMQDFIDDIP